MPIGRLAIAPNRRNGRCNVKTRDAELMDTYSGDNQIIMHPDDVAYTTLYADSDILCYKVTPFDLVNVEATYKRMVNKLFKNMLGQKMESYMDDMLVQYVKVKLNVMDLRVDIECVGLHNVHLNLSKYTFMEK